MARTQTARSIIAVATLCAALAGCSTRTNVSAIGNSPPLYTHVYLTAQAVWFNNSATAGPDDAGWAQFNLSTPVTVDLVADSGGNFAYLATDLKLAPGSYSQVRFIPVDASTPLTASAQTLGAKYNMEVDYVDSSGTTQQLPLELLNPDKGLAVQTSLSVPVGSVGASTVAGGLGGTGSTSSTATGFASTTGTTSTTTGTGTTIGVGGTTGSTSTTAEFALNIDGAHDLTGFTYSGAGGVLLSNHANATDLSQAGGIQGQLTLTNLTLSSANGTPGITASAESLSADGTRHVVVASAPVATDGSFTVYPLAANSSNNTSYDLVIHGAGIATIIIKDIIVPPTGKGGITAATLTGGSSSTTSTTTSSTTSTSSNTDTSPITPANLVSVGTLLPRAAGTSSTTGTYTANISNASAPLPAGAEVGFYQTLSGSSEVPYLIEAQPIDPFNQVLGNPLGNPQTLVIDTVDSGTYVSSGATITVVSAAPQEAQVAPGTYRVAASAPFYDGGSLGVEVSPPTASGATAATPPTVGGLSLATGYSAGAVTATVKLAAALAKYDSGEVMLSQNGQLVASAPLDAAIKAGGGTVKLSLPGGNPASLYYVTVRAWHSGAPPTNLTRQWYPDAVDLRTGSSASVQLTIN